jgi:hypothetical protein
MAAGRLIFPGFMPCENANGDRVAGAKAYFYDDGTADLATIYTTTDLDVAHANPVIADSDGVWPQMWADTAELFTVSLTDGDGVPLSGATWSGVSSAIDATLASADLAESAQLAAEAAQGAAEAAQEGAEAAEAQAEAIVAEHSGAPFTATSATSWSPVVATKAFVLNEAGKLFSDGQTIVVAREAPNAATRGVGLLNGVTEDVDGVQTLSIDFSIAADAVPTGPYTDWQISLGADGGVQSIAGETGIVTAAEAKAALAIASTDITDFETAVSDVAVGFAIVL